MDEEIPTESVPEVPEVPETPTEQESPAEETPEVPVAEEKTEGEPDAEKNETDVELPTESSETTVPDPGAELPTTDGLELPMHPQMFSTDYITDDYMITLIHELTLGDILIATLLCVLIIVQVLKIMLRRW